MEEYAVVVDSASDVPKEYVTKYNIHVVPIYIHYNNNEYKDGVDITSEQVYTLQKEKKAIFTSSSPSPGDFVNMYERLLKDYDRIISIHISSKLSAVIKSAKIARDFLKANKRIEIFDSLSGTMGTGFIAIAAAKAARKKYSLDKVLPLLEFLRENTRLYGTINTLKYLTRSGRVPALASIISAILKIKPLLRIRDGLVEMGGIAVTRGGSIREIVGRTIKSFKKEKWVIVSIIHTLCLEEAKKIMKRLQSSLNCVESIITECTPVVGAHTGPGLIGIIISKLNNELLEIFV
ncbi:MAG: DegV family protein [Actinobacteria bacterium]|nr:DegV family protein [Actinomycetota bacterium]